MDLPFTRLQAFFPAAKKIIIVAPFWVRLTIIFLCLLVGFTVISVVSYERFSAINTYRFEVSKLEERAITLLNHKNLRDKMEKQIQSASKNYVKERIESLLPLQKEKIRVSALARQFPDNPFLKERLFFLESDQNQIHFDQEWVGKDMKLKLSRRVQMDLDDLKRFLESLEGDRYDATKQKPFLIIKKFDLLKCYEKGDEKVYSIYVEMINKI